VVVAGEKVGESGFAKLAKALKHNSSLLTLILFGPWAGCEEKGELHKLESRAGELRCATHLGHGGLRFCVFVLRR